MIESLNYIYLAMYILDLYDGAKNLVGVILAISGICTAFCVAIFLLQISDTDRDWVNEGKPLCKRILKYSSIVLALTSIFIAIVPSKNTVKVFFGVKAVQSVMTYIDNSTIPERTKKTVDNLWNKVDNYLTTIDIDSTATAAVSNSVSNTVDSTITKTIEQTIKN